MTLALALTWSASAPACGGFFCSLQAPVDQAGEEILFAVDESAGTVTMHVEIQYQGPSEEFAWILPVPAEPELAVGTDALFSVLSGLRAQYALRQRPSSSCEVSKSAATPDSDDGGGGVEVLATGAVGPYETAVLSALDGSELIDWLQARQFDIPDEIGEVLEPYVAAEQVFVALRLAKDRDAGDLEPLAVTWKGTGVSIPIRLTSVAATPDMRLRIYVLGEHRAVPDSYLHVQLNHLAIDWWTLGGNLESVITAAADEAGGHAFFTDYAGPTDLVAGQLYVPGWEDAALDEATGALDLLERVVSSGLPLDDPMLGVLSAHLGLPEERVPELDLLDVFDCLAPYKYGYRADTAGCLADELAAIEVDPAAVAADVEAAVLEPRRRTDALLAAHPKITRLTSSVSPVEMTVDPRFVFNPDMPDVPLTRRAVDAYDCGSNPDIERAPRVLTLDDGRRVHLPSAAALQSRGVTEIQWLENQGLTTPVNAVIEKTGASGSPEIVVDNRDALREAVESSNARIDEDDRACGCAQDGGRGGRQPHPSGGRTSALTVAGLVLGLVARRRR